MWSSSSGSKSRRIEEVCFGTQLLLSGGLYLSCNQSSWNCKTYVWAILSVLVEQFHVTSLSISSGIAFVPCPQCSAFTAILQQCVYLILYCNVQALVNIPSISERTIRREIEETGITLDAKIQVNGAIIYYGNINCMLSIYSFFS